MPSSSWPLLRLVVIIPSQSYHQHHSSFVIQHSSRHHRHTGFRHHSIVIMPALSCHRRHCIIVTYTLLSIICHTFVIMPLWSCYCSHSRLFIQLTPYSRRHLVVLMSSSLFHHYNLGTNISLSSYASVVQSISFFPCHFIFTASMSCLHEWPWQASAIANWDDIGLCGIKLKQRD